MRSVYFIVFVVLMTSCNKQDGGIPSYIYIEGIHLQTDFQTEGTNSHDIIDAWVYVDDNPIGVFELPARVPILAEGNHSIKIYGGVKADGISARRRLYPFYQPFEIPAFNLRRGQVDTLNGIHQPVLSYYSSAELYIWRDAHFDDVGVPFTADGLSDTTMNRTTDPAEVFEGSGSGYIFLDTDQEYIKTVSSANLDPPKGGMPVYLELNYKTDNTLRVGLRSINSGGFTDQDNTVITPSYDDYGNLVWKKIYIELTELVSTNGSSTRSEVYFKVIKDEGKATSTTFIDNVKVLYAN